MIADKACVLLKDMVTAELQKANGCLSKVAAMVKTTGVNASCSDKVLDRGVKMHLTMRDHTDVLHKCITSTNTNAPSTTYGAKNQYCKGKDTFELVLILTLGR